jgi:hypothetical protein
MVFASSGLSALVLALHVFAEPERHGIDRPELLDHFVLPVLTVPALGDSPQSHCMLSCQAGLLVRICRLGAECIDGRQLIAGIYRPVVQMFSKTDNDQGGAAPRYGS